MNRWLIQNKLTNHLRTIIDYKQIRKKKPDLSHPALWYEDYPISLIGRRQSPISIKKNHCTLNNQNIQLPNLNIEYPNLFNNLKIRNPKDNTYFGWRIDVPYDFGDKAVISGGPLNNKYKLIQFHAHWGKDCHCGSEHIINGKQYSAELHFVHWNYELYSSARQAATSKDGLAVVAVFLEAVDNDNLLMNSKLDSLNTICNCIPEIKYKGSIKLIEKQMNILELYPENRSYYTYLGSLTTPPLWETVIWIIFEDPILCTKNQLESFREISYYQKEEVNYSYLDRVYQTNVEENIRPIQPLNERQIIYVNKNK